MVAAFPKNPIISSISENDKRVLKSRLYTSPSVFPPLEIHFSGKNGLSSPSNQDGYALISVAGCGECMISTPQGNSGGEGNATQGNPVATFHTLEDNIAHIDSASLSISSKGKMHQRAFSGGAKGNI